LNPLQKKHATGGECVGTLFLGIQFRCCRSANHQPADHLTFNQFSSDSDQKKSPDLVFRFLIYIGIYSYIFLVYLLGIYYIVYIYYNIFLVYIWRHFTFYIGPDVYVPPVKRPLPPFAHARIKAPQALKSRSKYASTVFFTRHKSTTMLNRASCPIKCHPLRI